MLKQRRLAKMTPEQRWNKLGKLWKNVVYNRQTE